MSGRILTGLAAAAAIVAIVVGSGALAAGAPGSSGGSTERGSTRGASASTKALAVRIVFPDGRVVGSVAALGATGGVAQEARSYSYPADGSVIVAGRVSAAGRTNEAKTASASASATTTNFSLFDGEITADSATAHATAATIANHAGGGFAGTAIVNLQALGRRHAFGRATLADWGYLTIGSRTVDRSGGGTATVSGIKSYDGVSVALDIHLTASHGGLPAGAEVQIGYAEAQAQTAAPVIVQAGPEPGDAPQLLTPATGALVGVPQVVAPELTAGPYDFPVYGSTSSADGYGNARQNLTWQHGIDLLGRLGQPLVAVADGTLYSVGWNHASGNRLWLRDRAGNQFLYAHLSAFSTLAGNGVHVRAGQVIGFMGDTGSTSGLKTHLHFEVHPVSMLFVGHDGAVDPTTYFPSWHRIANLAFAVGPGWAPKVPGTLVAPEPGAVLLSSTDISTSDGLDPDSLRRLLRERLHQPPSAG